MVSFKASGIGIGLLAAIYVGFSYVAAHYSASLALVPPDELIATVAVQVLGEYAGIVVCSAVSLACLTTAIALSSVFADFIHKDISYGKISYPLALIGTLTATYFISTLNFKGIVMMLAPILQLCYPALIALSIVNILHKLYHFQPVKVPVFIVFGLSVLGYFLN
jgi:LIVCS family branched-chain amino acid:cation transporter